MSLNQNDQSKIEKFLVNQSTAEEAEEVANYLINHPEELDKILLFEELTEEEFIKSTNKDKIYTSIIPNRRFKIWKSWVAAACLIGALSAIGYYVMLQKIPVELLITHLQDKILIDNNTKINRLYYFSDSSSAVLSSNSSLEHVQLFETNRQIHQLNGDIYYTVMKDPEHPFEVIANGIKTRAVGTQFLIKNNLKNDRVEILLTEGKVRLSSVDPKFEMNDIYLDPGQSCSIDKISGKIAITSFSKGREKAEKVENIERAEKGAIIWSNSEIQLTKVRLSSVFKRLESTYNVKIEYQDSSLAAALITGKIYHSDSLDMILRSICEINQLDFQKDKDVIYIKRK